MDIFKRRLRYLMRRLRAGQGNQEVLVAQIVRTYNQTRNWDHRRRPADALIQGWKLV